MVVSEAAVVVLKAIGEASSSEEEEEVEEARSPWNESSRRSAGKRKSASNVPTNRNRSTCMRLSLLGSLRKIVRGLQNHMMRPQRQGLKLGRPVSRVNRYSSEAAKMASNVAKMASNVGRS